MACRINSSLTIAFETLLIQPLRIILSYAVLCSLRYNPTATYQLFL